MTGGRIGSRMRSMWDSIEYHCWPINKLAAMVTASGPWMEEERSEKTEALSPVQVRRLTISDVVDVTRAPPEGIKDKRGMRSEHFVIVGYSRTKRRVKVATPSAIRNRHEKGFGYQGSRNRMRTDQIMESAKTHLWFVMRKDGLVFEAKDSDPTFPRKLTKLENHLADSLTKESGDRLTDRRMFAL